MSLSSRDQYIAVLGASGVGLYRRRGELCDALGQEPFEQAQIPDWQAAGEALGRLLGACATARGELRVVLSNHFCRFCLVPWGEQIATPEEMACYARACFEEIYGQLAEGWAINLSPEAAGRARLAVAVQQPLLLLLRELAGIGGWRLTSVAPYLMAAFNSFSRFIDQDDFLFVVAEPGRCNLLLARGGNWVAVRSVSSADSDSALSTLIEREHELQGGGDGTFAAIYVHAPGRADCAPAPRGGVSPRALSLPVQQGRDVDALSVMAMMVD
ncbi:hypothetical protein [Zestomonas carbonaria]|uniref:Uncharacterized protein n=1 Tax=Zestomonas carbonaria TaxID=2762745 RepID=A0A7U7EQR1_9GAMM|nr:hypothetical protein [Pseudomonas carbonaria]CAD5108982.1 hypothetical protein PSEWESI4_03278 [Pseudomonas carbonaria]